MIEPLFLQPFFQERIWGGKALKDEFQYEIPSQKTGECWAISAHPHGTSIVKNGEYAGKTLMELWEQKPELFGNHETKVFPLLTKILDANADLSVQVHPNDEYAAQHENGELGKTECWYIIDCEKGAELIFGHKARTKEEFERLIEKNEWDKLLRRVPIKRGDFFYVPSGTIHALCEGTLVLETQQSSDTTYRLYDYDRVGQDGKKRELHLNQSLAVTTIPHETEAFQPEVKTIPGAVITKFVKADYFTVYKYDVHDEAQFEQPGPFLLASVIEGEAELTVSKKSYPIKKGDHFILPAQIKDFQIEGKAMLITSHV